MGDPFEANDRILLFVDGDSIKVTDDRWDNTQVSAVTASSDTDCASYWPGKTLQVLKLDGQDMTGVQPGSPVRGYQWVTYGLYDFGPLGWGLGRHQGTDRPDHLVGGLQGPGAGLRFDYFTPAGIATTDPAGISRLRITVRTDPRGNTDVQSEALVSNLFLRNN